MSTLKKITSAATMMPFWNKYIQLLGQSNRFLFCDCIAYLPLSYYIESSPNICIDFTVCIHLKFVRCDRFPYFICNFQKSKQLKQDTCTNIQIKLPSMSSTRNQSHRQRLLIPNRHDWISMVLWQLLHFTWLLAVETSRLGYGMLCISEQRSRYQSINHMTTNNRLNHR